MTNVTIPLVYKLLIGKSSEDYNLFVEKILAQTNVQSELIISDFKTSRIKSIKDMLPDILHKSIC